MPTDRANRKDRELSKLLSQADPPRSPPHVDEAILTQARRKAEEQRRRGNSSRRPWFGPHWTPALSVISVVAIAISISLQIFDEPSTEPATAVLESARSPADPDFSGDEIENVESIESRERVATTVAPSRAQEVEETEPAQSPAADEPARQAISTSASSVAADSRSADTAGADQDRAADTPDASVEEVIVTGNSIRPERQLQAQQNLPAFPEAERPRFLAWLAAAILADWRERDIDAETLSEAAREFELLRERVLAEYARLSARALAQAQQRYETLVSNTELPAAGSLDQAITQLQRMEP